MEHLSEESSDDGEDIVLDADNEDEILRLMSLNPTPEKLKLQKYKQTLEDYRFKSEKNNYRTTINSTALL